MSKKLVSIIVPVYNEEKNIELLYQILEKVWSSLEDRFDYELIFINDGSTDKSSLIIERLVDENNHIKYIEFSRNFGKEIATTAGINHSLGDAAIMIDADLQHPPEIIPEFIKKWENGSEVVIGVRQLNKGEGLIKKWGSILYYKIINKISDVKLVPMSTDFRLIDRIVIDEFNRFTEANRMTRALIAWLGFKRDYIYFSANARFNGNARYSFRKLLKLAISSFVSLSLLPLKLAGYLGTMITFVFGLWGIYILIFGYIFHMPFARSFSGPAQLAILIVFLVGIILMSLGLMALYIANIHGEVINRPKYVIRKRKGLVRYNMENFSPIISKEPAKVALKSLNIKSNTEEISDKKFN